MARSARPNRGPMPKDEPLGLKSGTVVVVPYDPRWTALFEQCKASLHQALGPDVLEVHHVGSTAVPGLCAKPILDILASISDFDRGPSLVPALQELGYEYRPDNGIPDRLYFRLLQGTTRTHHLSLAERSSNHHRATLAFRDALRADPQVLSEYAELKLRLARQYPRNREAYIEGKTAFVARVLGGSPGADV